MKIKIGLLPRAIGVFDDLLFACHIKGMAEGNGVIGLRVAVNVGGLEVVFDACPPARPTSPPLPDPAGASASRQGSGLRQPARLRTLAEVEGSIVRKVDQVDYTPSELTLDLGGTCPIFQRRSMTLVIHNLSAIAANFELGFANYPAPDQDGKGKASKGERGGRDAAAGLHRAPGETAFDGEANPAAVVEQSKDPPRLLPSSTTRAPKALLKPTSKDQQRFHSVTGQTYSTVVKESRHAGLLDQEMLQAGLGAALLAVPSRGRLEPRQSVQVQITSFNNLSGRYLDQLVVKVEHWLQRSIPVRMSVVGSPTRFVGRSIAADSADGSSLCRVNFGIRVVSNELGRLPLSAEVGGVVTKIAQVENQSPKAVVLDWRVYSVSSASASAGGGGGGGQQGDIVGRADVELGTILQRANSTGDGTPPFDISPRSILINAFQTQTMSISFGSPTPGIFNGAICAGVQVRERDGSAWPNAHEPATRPGSASIDKNLLALVPVILRVHGKSIAPHVTLDCGDRVRMKVRGRPDLPEAGAAPAPAPVVSRVINVSNTTDAEFGVELRCAAPFRAVFNLSPEQQRRRDRRAAGGGFHPGREVQHAPTEYSFMPKEETVMTVYFDHQAHLDALRGAARRPASPAAAPSQTPPPSAHGELTVVFSNGSTQVIPLAVELQSPGAKRKKFRARCPGRVRPKYHGPVNIACFFFGISPATNVFRVD
ncbi:MAG: hypothetical protein BJ554DRAFT_3871 [Olpidium bornovanus]|uniref:Uncharacterized protein n=1 Tax=Olpidium bornovanus TaxID=278681 RepID=A0A8H8DFI0_9FUNG|nr:MAG: hypothetical protein BJ554DRAFT_3871 [Olpidium bornovanus]